MGAGGDDRGVQIVDGVGDFRGGAGGDLLDGGHPVLFVAGVDALGAVAGEEILVEGEPGNPLQHRHAIFLGGAGVNGGFVNHDVALLEGLADGLGGLDQRGQVRAAVLIDGGGHGDDVDVAAFQGGGVGAEAELGGFLELFGAHLAGGIKAGLQGLDARRVDVEADHRAVLAEFRRQGQAHIAKPDYRQFYLVQGRHRSSFGLISAHVVFGHATAPGFTVGSLRTD